MRDHALAGTAGSIEAGRRSARPFGLLAVLLSCAAALLGIGAPAASAAPEAGPGWVQQGVFGEIDAGAELTASPLAVDGNGNIFAPLQTQSYARAYRPDGSFLAEYQLSGLVRNLAVDPSDDTLYSDEIAGFGGSTVRRWTSDGQPVPTYTLDPGFEAPQGGSIAVDPTTGNLLVTDPGAEAVRRYNTSGTLLATIATPSISPTWLAMAPDGSFYVAPAGGSDVTHLTGTGTVQGTIVGVGSLDGLTFEPSNELLVASVGGKLKTYSASGQLLSEVSSAGAAGLAANGSGLLYGVSGGSINVYGTVAVPGVEAPVVTNVQPSSVHISAEVDPGAGPPEGSRAHFEYSADGGESWTSTPDEGVERTVTDEPDTIETDLTGLTLNADYLVRVKAANSVAENTSSATSFSTPEIAPVVETGNAGDRTETSAMLYGTVNPAGIQTGYHFEYGTTTAYGSRVPLETEAPAGNRRVPRDVSKLITGLQPGTTYHYRLVAENAVGTTNGADRTFKTLESSDVFPQRAYEQVTPVDKGGAAVLSDSHFQTAADGSAIAVASVAASKDSQSALILQNYLSRRGSSDWLDWEQVDPPQDGMPGLHESATTAISEDFEHALVISNRALAPGGIAGGGNLYVKDLLTGDCTFVAGAPGEDSWGSLVGLQANERIFLGAAPDFSWIVFFAQPSFLPSVGSPAVYRWTRSTAELSVESLLPGDVLPPFLQSQLPPSNVITIPSVSSDGQVVGYGLGAAGGSVPVGVYRRENGQITPVSASKIPGDPADAQPAWFDGITPDGRYVFFHGELRLTEDSPVLELGQASLYRYDAATDTLTYLGRTRSDSVGLRGFSADGQTVLALNPDGAGSVWRNGQLKQLSNDPPSGANVSASGRYFSWVDETGVNLYDTVDDEKVCVSCPAGGGSGAGAATIANGRTIGNRTPRSLLDDGTVFFTSPTRLLAADHNGTKDVYAYKNGNLTLISPGNAGYDAFFVDASEDGSSVFFQTNQGLVKQDVDGNADIYVARIGGGFASQNPPPPPGSCKGAECAEAGGQPAGGPPVTTAGTANPATPRKKHKAHKKHKSKKKHKGKRPSAGSASATHSKTLGK
ncbi:MAG TPA: hypothetical protein VHR18_10450 [Solirubrobacterales bacterium]|nr:hypothetical protein [Solirubrobacterales bacterium]